MVTRRWLPWTCLPLVACGALPPAPELQLSLREPAARERFCFTDAGAWRTEAGPDGGLALVDAARYAPPHRSPLALAILTTPPWYDLDLHVQARQTGREYPHRDLVFVFGYRDAAHFAYAHLASAADANAHHVMLVDGADRRPVTTWRSSGVRWGDRWHDVQLTRRGTTVDVAFDGVPVLRADVPAWPGLVGFGSFDDTGCFRDLRVIAPAR